MALKALSIIEKEFADARTVLNEANVSDSLKALFDTVRKHIIYRIEKECIEQPEMDDDVDVVDCGEFTVEVEVDRDLKAELRDHMRKGGDPATFGTPASPKCTWCKTEDAVDSFWVQEPGEFRNSKEDLCEVCAGSLPEDGIRVEVVQTEPQVHCRFCGLIEEHCHGGNEREDGEQAHDFTPLTPEEIHPLDDVPF